MEQDREGRYLHLRADTLWTKHQLGQHYNYRCGKGNTSESGTVRPGYYCTGTVLLLLDDSDDNSLWKKKKKNQPQMVNLATGNYLL